MNVRQTLESWDDRPSDQDLAGILTTPEVVPELIEVLETSDHPQARFYAALILRQFEDERAIPALLALLLDPQDDPVEPSAYDQAIHALIEIGTAVVEPALAFSLTTDNPDVQSAICEILSSIGPRDPRIFELLLRFLEHNVDLGGHFLADYGDPAALPHLHRAFAMLDFNKGRTARSEEELALAIESLGGELSPTEQDRLQQARALGPPPRLARNAACWCGSGKKYKRCHYDEDHA